ncbi:MAG: hypothetical protein KBS94_03980, partial [Prevotella sp.]|nr:hypothetical protein [Candidatus Equicola faecalis]
FGRRKTSLRLVAHKRWEDEAQTSVCRDPNERLSKGNRAFVKNHASVYGFTSCRVGFSIFLAEQILPHVKCWLKGYPFLQAILPKAHPFSQAIYDVSRFGAEEQRRRES